MHNKLMLSLAVFAVAFGAGFTRLGFLEAANANDDVAIVTAMAQPELMYAVCFAPTRANIAAQRAACDEEAERRGYTHGVLRPPNPKRRSGGCVSGSRNRTASNRA